MSETESQRIVRESREILRNERSDYSRSGSGGMFAALLFCLALVVWTKRR